MTWQKINEMPCVITSLRRAEEDIKAMTGVQVRLIMHEVAITDEQRKEILQDVVCSYFNVSWKAVASKSREEEILLARHIYMYFSVKFCKFSTVETGADCGGRDHSTVNYAVNKITGFYEVNDNCVVRVEEVKALLPKVIFK